MEITWKVLTLIISTVLIMFGANLTLILAMFSSLSKRLERLEEKTDNISSRLAKLESDFENFKLRMSRPPVHAERV